MIYIGNTLYGYSEKKYGNTVYEFFLVKKLNLIFRYIYNFSDKHPKTKKLCVALEKVLCIVAMFLEKLWVKRNHLVELEDKILYERIFPIIINDKRKLCCDNLVYYIHLLEKYGKKELDTWGFEDKPFKKIGFFKKLWYNITFKAY